MILYLTTELKFFLDKKLSTFFSNGFFLYLGFIYFIALIMFVIFGLFPPNGNYFMLSYFAYPLYIFFIALFYLIFLFSYINVKPLFFKVLLLISIFISTVFYFFDFPFVLYFLSDFSEISEIYEFFVIFGFHLYFAYIATFWLFELGQQKIELIPENRDSYYWTFLGIGVTFILLSPFFGYLFDHFFNSITNNFLNELPFWFFSILLGIGIIALSLYYSEKNTNKISTSLNIIAKPFLDKAKSLHQSFLDDNGFASNKSIVFESDSTFLNSEYNLSNDRIDEFSVWITPQKVLAIIKKWEAIKDTILTPDGPYYQDMYANKTSIKFDFESFGIPVSQIVYFKLIGTKNIVSEVTGGGSTLGGAVVGGLIAGDTGAIIGSRKGIKTNHRTIDNRQVILVYKQKTTQKTKTFNGSFYEAFLALIPKKEK